MTRKENRELKEKSCQSVYPAVGSEGLISAISSIAYYCALQFARLWFARPPSALPGLSNENGQKAQKKMKTFFIYHESSAGRLVETFLQSFSIRMNFSLLSVDCSEQWDEESFNGNDGESQNSKITGFSIGFPVSAEWTPNPES
jgi:hypothetical protein